MVCRLERLWAVCNNIVPRLLAQGHLRESELIVSHRQTTIQVNFVDLYGSRVYVVN